MDGFSKLGRLKKLFPCSPLRQARDKMAAAPLARGSCDYEETIRILNSFETNPVTLNNVKRRIQRREESPIIKLGWKYLSRTGVGPEELKKLSVIHIAGTKGKGTTSALCESILRHHGYHTGLYTSPHLVSVTERIQLAGCEISKTDFAKYFARVYNSLFEKQEFEGDIPGYFMFLTVLAFNIFLQEKVDVAIVEVGIGGEYDVTNIVNNVVAAGITSLALEHTAILGNTIEQIAREKGGIMKQGCRAFSVTQSPQALIVLQNIALTRNCTLNVVPDFEIYDWETTQKPSLSADLPAFKMNASLAIQLAHTWMSKRNCASQNGNIYTNLKQIDICNGASQISSTSNNCREDKTNGFCIENDVHIKEKEKSKKDLNVNQTFIEKFVNRNECITKIPRETCEGISMCVWPGRCQIFSDDTVDFYIDGAHTVESMEVCTHWFKQHARPTSTKILVFNITGDRKPETLLELLISIEFKVAMFVPSIAFANKKNFADQTKSCDKMLLRCKENMEAWIQLQKKWTDHRDEKIETILKLFGTMEEGLEYVKTMYKNNLDKPQVLITGSLHLVGAALAVLDPELKCSKKQIAYNKRPSINAASSEF